MFILILLLLGLCFGSFTSALVYRLRMQSNSTGGTKQKPGSKKRKEKFNKENYSILNGRSMCPKCKHTLAWFDLLPVVSWVMLGGKCRYCHKKIEDSPLVEIGLAALFVLSYLSWPYGFDEAGSIQFGFWLVFLVGFMALTVYDLKWMELPNLIIYPLILLAVLQVVCLSILGGGWGGVARAFYGFLGIGGLFYVMFQLSGGKWIGGGDVKLGFVIGPLVGGLLGSILVLFFASVLGSLYALPQLFNKSLKISSRIPFGPFLLVATYIVYLYGQRLTEWYISLLVV